MKTHIFRLGSIVIHGVGGPEAGSIDLIYSLLLQKYKQDFYSRIGINQIGDDLNEIILKQSGKNININIRYPVFEDFEMRSTEERNRIRLDVAHQALTRIAESDKKLDVAVLEQIRDEIIKNDFNFEFVYRSIICKSNPDMTANISVNPQIDGFLFYLSILNKNVEICKKLIYTGLTTPFYFHSLFSKVKWHKDQTVSVTGDEQGMEIRLTVDKCHVEYINHTNYANAPFFTMMKMGKENKEAARADYIHSLPPALAAIITHEPN